MSTTPAGGEEPPEECRTCLSNTADLIIGACGHRLCLPCARECFVVGLKELAQAGGTELPVARDVGGGGRPPGLLCSLCLPTPDARAAYTAAFAEAVLARRVPTTALLAATIENAHDASANAGAWTHATAEHGLPPGWVSPAAFEAACGGTSA